MVPADVLRGDMPLCHWNSVDGGFLLDVRNPPELAVEQVLGAVNIPLPELRGRLSELPKDREILVICRSAQRAYYATHSSQTGSARWSMLSRSMLVQSEIMKLLSTLSPKRGSRNEGGLDARWIMLRVACLAREEKKMMSNPKEKKEPEGKNLP
jgi:hypothetical protein